MRKATGLLLTESLSPPYAVYVWVLVNPSSIHQLFVPDPSSFVYPKPYRSRDLGPNGAEY
jgi:hypothetical protein